MAIVCVLSLAALFYLFQKHIAGRPLLEYQSRSRVPWGFRVVLLAMSMPLLAVLAYFLGGDQATTEEVPIENFLLVGSVDSIFKILFVFGIAAWLISFFRANTHDLGLPTSWKQLANDMGIGTIACIAALLPINFLQFSLVQIFDSKTLHPLVKQLQENHTPSILILSFVMAVIAAPLFEEFTFRGLLQGWLERREDEAIAFTDTERQPHAPVRDMEVIGEEEGEGKEGQRRDVARQLLDDTAKVHEETSLRLETEITNPARPTHGWIPLLPHGWTPILISGVAFGLAHIGHGVAPVSLVLFGIVLGYLYQRTHRLVPSITAHMLFNAYSMGLLWLQLG